MSVGSRRRPLQPPAFARSLIDRSVPEDVLGDLDESWRRVAELRGGLRARIWYWRQALAWLRNVGALRRTSRPIPRFEASTVSTLIEDARHALRSLRRAPAFSLACIAVLGLGLGAATTIFSLANWVLFRPVPGVERPEQLATLRLQPEDGSFTMVIPHPLVEAVRERVAAFEQVAAYTQSEAHLAVAGTLAARPVEVEIVTANYFVALAMPMALGRGFTADEAAGGDGDPHVAVISSRLWRDAFGSDPGVLGRELIVNGRAMRVVGVAARGYLGPALPGDVDLWAPVAAHDVVLPLYGERMLTDWNGGPWFNLIGRLAEGAALDLAREQLAAAERAMTPQMASLDGFDLVVMEGVGATSWTRQGLVRTVSVLSLAVSFLLLITCANFGNLLLAYGRRRSREIAVRAAVGAGRARLVRQQLVASTALALAGGLLGLVASSWAVGLFRSASVFTWVDFGDVGLDYRVALFSLGTALLCGSLFGVLPALSVTREGADLMAPARTRDASSRRLRTGLLVLQLAVSFALVVGSFLMARTLANLRDIHLGIQPDPVVGFEIKPGIHGYEGDALADFYPRLLERVAAVPGVDSVSLSWAQPFGRMRNNARLLVEGVKDEDAAVSADQNTVAPGFFETLGIRLIAGRTFEPADAAAGAPSVAVVSQTLAERLYPEGAVGRTVAKTWSPETAVTIVGVVADVRLNSARDDFAPWLFEVARPDQALPWAAVQVRTRRPPADLVPELRAAVAGIDDTLPLFEPGPMRGLIEQRFAQPALLSRTSTVFAALALLLAAAGLYAVLSTTVSERAYELGVRAALGATAAGLARMVLGGGLRVALGGAVLGAALALGLGRVLESVLFEVPSIDPLAMLVAAVVLVAVTLGASLIPARRASRLDPVSVLRQE